MSSRGLIPPQWISLLFLTTLITEPTKPSQFAELLHLTPLPNCWNSNIFIAIDGDTSAKSKEQGVALRCMWGQGLPDLGWMNVNLRCPTGTLTLMSQRHLCPQYCLSAEMSAWLKSCVFGVWLIKVQCNYHLVPWLTSTCTRLWMMLSRHVWLAQVRSSPPIYRSQLLLRLICVHRCAHLSKWSVSTCLC